MAGTRSSRIAGPSLWVAVALVGGACATPLGSDTFVPTSTPVRSDAIVVLGNRPPRGPDGEIAPESERRVRRGVELFQDGLAPVLVMAGGPAPGGGTEAEVMAEYARSLGVPAAQIRQERRSTDTAENARYTMELLCGSEPACAPHLLVVSSPYHLRRALDLFACAGALATGVATEVPDDLGYQFGFVVYEYAAGIAGQLSDTCSRARPRLEGAGDRTP